MNFKQSLKLANGYCLECQRPLSYNKHYLCPYCIKSLKLNGLEHRRVSYTSVGEITINYQQHLHRTFFSCNAPYAYRGEITNRKRNSIAQSSLDIASNKLDIFLSHTIQDKQLSQAYTAIKSSRNAQRRILYSITLYSIAYFILDSKQFKSEEHFKSSIVNQLSNDIKRLYIRQHLQGDKILKYHNISNNTMKSFNNIYSNILSIVKPLLVEL